MSDQNKKFIHRWYDEVWNKSNEGAIDEMFHPEGKAYGLGGEPLVGTEGFKSFYKTFKNDYEDIRVSIDNTLTDGDYVTILARVNATHKDTGKPVNFSGASIALVKDNQLMSGWNYFDFLTLNLQIGKITPEQLL